MWHAQRMLDQVLAKRHVSLAVICFSLLAATMLAAASLRSTKSFGSRGNSRLGDRILDKRKSFCPGPETEPSERKEAWNQKFARQLSAEVASLDADKGCELAFYGDSIIETWRASDGGRACPRCEGVSEVFKQYFGNFTTSVLAIGGDQAMHLLWRLQHGQIFEKHQPKLAFVLIGTNDLGAASCLGGEAAILQAAAGTVERIVQNLDYLMLNSPTTHIVVLGILPRGYWQDPKDMFKLPSAFSRAISAVNQELEHFAFGHQKMHYIDCTKAFVQTGNLSPELMPDALHPNAAGMALLAECILPFVKLYGSQGLNPMVAANAH